MKDSEKIGIAIVIVLIMILAISVWAAKNNSGPKKMNCDIDCRPTGEQKWTFPGGGPKAYFFNTNDECIRACQLKNR